MTNPNRAEIGKIFTLKFLFQLFGIGAIFLFLLSNLFQPNFWSIKTAGATDDEGIGISLDDNPSYNSSLKVNISNNGNNTPAGPLTVQLGVYHCNTSNARVCSPNDTPGDLATDSSRSPSNTTVNVPAKGTETSFTQTGLPSFPACGSVQVDYGRAGHSPTMGGKVFNLGPDCGAPPPSSCPDDLKYCDTSVNKIVHKHGGVPDSSQPGGCRYAFDVTTESCGVTPPAPPVPAPPPAPPAPPAPAPPGQPVVCNDNEISLSASPNAVNAGQPINFAISGDASTYIGDDFRGGVVNCSGVWNSQTCQASQPGNYTWTHTWRHCAGDVNNCSGVCSKQASFNVNGNPPPPPPPPPTSSTTK